MIDPVYQNNSKRDYSSIVGFGLIALVFVGYMWFTSKNAPVVPPQDAQGEATAVIDSAKIPSTVQIADLAGIEVDSALKASLARRFGDFYYSATLPSASDSAYTVLENDVLEIRVANKGGMPSLVRLKKYDGYHSHENVCLIKDGNADLNTVFHTSDGRLVNTREMYFEPSLNRQGENVILSMRLKASPESYLEYVYTLSGDQYLLDFSIVSKNLSGMLDLAQGVKLDWTLEGFHTEKGLKYENQYTYLQYSYGDKKDTDLSISGEDEESESGVRWFAFKQQFFSTILITADNGVRFPQADFKSSMIEDSLFTKKFVAGISLPEQKSEINVPMKLYFGPNKFHTLNMYAKSEETNLERIVPLGWGIFGWINRFVVIPVFDILAGNWGLQMGLVILLLTLLVKTLLFPLTYKGYMSTAKMKLLKPEINQINEKFKDADPVKKQQATMELYNKAGVNPLAGCLPLVLQLPVLIAMYRFFPAAIELRDKSFLWAEDLSAYDSILNLPFDIPMYGAHVSLFTLLMAGALFFQTKVNGTGMEQQKQPGMPDMRIIMYLMPVMMLVFFNSSASGLTYYYFVSTLISIIQMYIIKHFFVNEEKLHARLMENRQNAANKKPSKFRQKYDEMLNKAQEDQQQKLNRQQRRMK